MLNKQIANEISRERVHDRHRRRRLTSTERWISANIVEMKMTIARKPSAIRRTRARPPSSARSSTMESLPARPRCRAARAPGQPALRLREQLSDLLHAAGRRAFRRGGTVGRCQPSLRLRVGRIGRAHVRDRRARWTVSRARDGESARRELKGQKGHGASIVAKPRGAVFSRAADCSSRFYRPALLGEI